MLSSVHLPAKGREIVHLGSVFREFVGEGREFLKPGRRAREVVGRTHPSGRSFREVAGCTPPSLVACADTAAHAPTPLRRRLRGNISTREVYLPKATVLVVVVCAVAPQGFVVRLGSEFHLPPQSHHCRQRRQGANTLATLPT